LIIRSQIGDISLRCGETGKKSENREIWAKFPQQIIWGNHQKFKTSFGYSFSGTITRKSLDHATRP